MKTSLDTLASTWSVSSSAYNTAVGNISSALITAGAPSNWATTWPDGTTSGPWPGIQTSLANLWAQVATQRTALQSVISSAQATMAQPHVVAWAYASQPALPSASYPAGYYAITSDSRTVQVNASGTAWVDVLVATSGLFGTLSANMITTGTLNAANVAVTNLNASNITTGTLAASKVSFPDGSVLTTAGVQTQTARPSSQVLMGSSAAINGFGWSVTASSTGDVFNVMASIWLLSGGAYPNFAIYLYVDGVSTGQYISGVSTAANGYTQSVCFVGSVTGLSVGTHTIQFYGYSPTNNISITTQSYAICQRIF
jgi:hypothetical protein